MKIEWLAFPSGDLERVSKVIPLKVDDCKY